ncbi:MAG: metallophosphoesterase, partial [Candidatus Gastranaerophilales bacterium]|nr:metallophosphoesterase [Candidatus Gastranaerophilales bacterium]
VLIVLIFIWACFVEPNLITVKKMTLQSDDIKGIRIVFISDFHFSKLTFSRFDRIIKMVNKQKPDIIISGGDYLFAHDVSLSMSLDKMAEGFSKMRSKYGIYSVLGNHDYYKNGEEVKNALKNKGIRILENSNYFVKINDKTLYIAGISDMQTTKWNLNKALLNTKPPVILVSHSPDITPAAKERVNLILAGHTHGGQVRLPLYGALFVPSKYGKRYEAGFIDNILYVSKGLGTSIIPIRFNCLPEITVIDYI